MEAVEHANNEQKENKEVVSLISKVNKLIKLSFQILDVYTLQVGIIFLKYMFLISLVI